MYLENTFEKYFLVFSSRYLKISCTTLANRRKCSYIRVPNRLFHITGTRPIAAPPEISWTFYNFWVGLRLIFFADRETNRSKNWKHFFVDENDQQQSNVILYRYKTTTSQCHKRDDFWFDVIWWRNRSRRLKKRRYSYNLWLSAVAVHTEETWLLCTRWASVDCHLLKTAIKTRETFREMLRWIVTDTCKLRQTGGYSFKYRGDTNLIAAAGGVVCTQSVKLIVKHDKSTRRLRENGESCECDLRH